MITLIKHYKSGNLTKTYYSQYDNADKLTRALKRLIDSKPYKVNNNELIIQPNLICNLSGIPPLSFNDILEGIT